MRSRLDNFLTSLENEYLDHFHEDRSEGTQELRYRFKLKNLNFSGV